MGAWLVTRSEVPKPPNTNTAEPASRPCDFVRLPVHVAISNVSNHPSPAGGSVRWLAGWLRVLGSPNHEPAPW